MNKKNIQMLSDDLLIGLGAILTLFVIPSSVFQFWLCDDFSLHLEHCPASLVWNTKNKDCDYAWNTDTSHCVMVSNNLNNDNRT